MTYLEILKKHGVDVGRQTKEEKFRANIGNALRNCKDKTMLFWDVLLVSEDMGMPIEFFARSRINENEYNVERFLEIFLFSNIAYDDFAEYLARISILLKTHSFSSERALRAAINPALERWGLPYTLCGNIIIPKGAKELDEALVADVADWLASYTKSHNLYISALQQYADNGEPVEIADNLRRSFEVFLHEFLSNNKNLDNNKNVVGQYLKEQGVSDDARNLFTTLIHYYKLDNDKTAKHHDKTDKNIVEFLLYQTGVFMRLLLTLRKKEV